MISAVMAVLNAVAAFPKIKELIDQIAALWVATQIANMKKENAEALRKALHEHDQRELEKAIGNSHPGEQSSIPGSRVVDSIPGVVHKPKTGGS